MKKLWVLGIALISLFIVFIYYISQDNIVTPEQYRIGVLISGPERLDKVKGLKEGLQKLGFIEGMNTSYEIKNANNSIKQMERYARDLGQMNLDVIVAGGAIETRYIKNDKNSTTPVVFLGVADAINQNLVEDYKKPNGRITGVENGHIELTAKRLQLFQLLLPTLERTIVVYDERIDASLLSLEEVKTAAGILNLEIVPISVSNLEQFKRFEAYSFQKKDGILVLPSYFLEEISPKLGALALKNKLPSFGVNSNDIAHGFLFSYGISYYDQGSQCASMVSQILKGIKPSNIPVEKPDSVLLLMNANVEKALNINISKAGEAFIHRVRHEE